MVVRHEHHAGPSESACLPGLNRRLQLQVSHHHEHGHDGHHHHGHEDSGKCLMREEDVE